MHMWILGASHQMKHPFSIWKGVIEYPWGQNKYNDMNNIIKIL